MRVLPSTSRDDTCAPLIAPPACTGCATVLRGESSVTTTSDLTPQLGNGQFLWLGGQHVNVDVTSGVLNATNIPLRSPYPGDSVSSADVHQPAFTEGFQLYGHVCGHIVPEYCVQLGLLFFAAVGAAVLLQGAIRRCCRCCRCCNCRCRCQGSSVPSWVIGLAKESIVAAQRTYGVIRERTTEPADRRVHHCRASRRQLSQCKLGRARGHAEREAGGQAAGRSGRGEDRTRQPCAAAQCV